MSIRSQTKAGKARVYTDQTSGPTDGDGSWRTSVERQLGELRTDMRHMFIGGLIAVAALLGAGWLAYKEATSQMREVAVQQEKLAGKLDTLDARMSGKFETLGVKIDGNNKTGALK